jgi:lipopolysaccharide biosynthesis protein
VALCHFHAKGSHAAFHSASTGFHATTARSFVTSATGIHAAAIFLL